MEKLAFAKLIAFLVSTTRYEFSGGEIDEIDGLAVMPTSLPVPSPAEVRFMLAAMRDGRKIEAIKSFRALTGDGLKESKDAIEDVISGMARSPAPCS